MGNISTMTCNTKITYYIYSLKVSTKLLTSAKFAC